MKVKHTPGPWSVDENGRFINYENPIVGKSFFLIHEKFEPGFKNEQAANMALIAAAPEMLEALKNLLDLIENNWLVRNTEKDQEPGFALKQIGPLGKIRRAMDVVAKATLFLPLLLFASCHTTNPATSSASATAFVRIGEPFVYEWTGTPTGSSQTLGAASTVTDSATNTITLSIPFKAKVLSLDFYMDEQAVFVTETGRNTYTITPKSKRLKVKDAVVIWIKK